MREKKRPKDIQKRDSRQLKMRAHCRWKMSWDGLGWLVGRRSEAGSALVALSRLRLETVEREIDWLREKIRVSS